MKMWGSFYFTILFEARALFGKRCQKCANGFKTDTGYHHEGPFVVSRPSLPCSVQRALTSPSRPPSTRREAVTLVDLIHLGLVVVQGYLAHKKKRPPLGPNRRPMLRVLGGS